MTEPHMTEPPSGPEYLRWRLEDIAHRMETQEGQLRGVREDAAEIKGEIKGLTKKVGWMCERVSAVGEEVEDQQKRVAVNAERIRDIAEESKTKVPREVCEKEMGKVSLFMRVFLFMLSGLLIAAALKFVLGIS